MKNITIYIILGTLVFAVILFLFATSLVERQKRKKMEAEKKIENEKKQLSGFKIAIILSHIINKNDILLKSFVPSVGKLKMSEIRLKAKAALLILEKTELFDLFKLSDFKDLMIIFNEFKKNNSNIWKKKLSNRIEMLDNIVQSNKSVEVKNSEIRKITNKINKIYKNEMT